MLSLVKQVSIDPNANFINIGLSGSAFGEDRKCLKGGKLLCTPGVPQMHVPSSHMNGGSY